MKPNQSSAKQVDQGSKPIRQPINVVNTHQQKKTPFEIYSDPEYSSTSSTPKQQQQIQQSQQIRQSQRNQRQDIEQEFNKFQQERPVNQYLQNDYDVTERENQIMPQRHYENQNQIMGERTNKMGANTRQMRDGGQNKEAAALDQDQEAVLNQKLAVLYNTNPMNVIPETWEQESRNSVMMESSSLQFLNKSRADQSQSQMQQYNNDSPYKPNNSEQREQSALLQQQQSARSQTSMVQKSSNNPNSYVNSSINDSNLEKSSKTETKKQKVEKIKTRLKQLFLNYCDFSIENGNIYITYTNFMKIIKDSKIIDDQKVTQNHLSIILSKECNGSNNITKNITFDQFLNCLLRISELKYPDLYKKYPKSALQSLLKTCLMPLLQKIEHAVESQCEDVQNSLYSVSEITLKLIVFNDDTQVIFSDIHPLLKYIYQMYFDQEITAQKGKNSDLQKASLKSAMNFVRDFELSPYLVHQKACFLIWYSVAYAQDTEELCNNPKQKYVFPPSMNLGKSFTLGHFAVFIYRLSVIYFNHSQDSASNFNLVKKLLYFFRKMENCDGFKRFMGKLNRTYNDSFSFLPSKDLLIQILKAEGVDDMITSEDIGYITKEAMISRIVDPHLYIKQTQNQVSQDDGDLDFLQESEQFLFTVEDDMKKLFEIYCSYGEPMNTKYLKSSKLLKLMKDCGLVKNLSKLPSRVGKHFHQLSHFEVDISFKQVSFQGNNQQLGGNGQFDPLQSQMFQGDQSHHTSGFLNFQSQLGSRMGNRILGGNTLGNQNSTLNKTMSFDQHSHLLDKNGSQGKLDFSQFKKVLESLSTKIVPEYPPTQAYLEVLKVFILPLQNSANEKRCVHSKKIQYLLTQLDNQDMIDLLTLFHKSIIDIYKLYADNKGFMNFSKFINFCTDYDIFPGMISKASLYRIFHSLSFINEILGASNKSIAIRSDGGSSKISTMRSLDKNQSQQQQSELIDEHLFIEALALCALFNGGKDEELFSPVKGENKGFQQDEFEQEDMSEQSSIEKMLAFIERMANSDGIYKRIKNGNDLSSSMKCNLMDKKDLLDLFRTKYAWYFRSKYNTDMANKKKNFQDIMEMSSVWTNASQLGGE